MAVPVATETSSQRQRERSPDKPEAAGNPTVTDHQSDFLSRSGRCAGTVDKARDTDGGQLVNSPSMPRSHPAEDRRVARCEATRADYLLSFAV